jgi:hypothetical protein
MIMFALKSGRSCLTTFLVSQAAGLIINLASNHFENDMLAQWTALWIHLKRVSGLELASITSDFDWKNFDTLSDLPR